MRDYNFFVYIMTNRPNGTLYTGVTNDLERRVVEHREFNPQSFTSRYNLHHLVWFEHHTDIGEAILREKRIKKWNRAWKVELIEATNPDWRDLSPPRKWGPPTVGPLAAVILPKVGIARH